MYTDATGFMMMVSQSLLPENTWLSNFYSPGDGDSIFLNFYFYYVTVKI